MYADATGDATRAGRRAIELTDAFRNDVAGLRFRSANHR